jgi:hypothetical protein
VASPKKERKDDSRNITRNELTGMGKEGIGRGKKMPAVFNLKLLLTRKKEIGKEILKK